MFDEFVCFWNFIQLNHAKLVFLLNFIFIFTSTDCLEAIFVFGQGYSLNAERSVYIFKIYNSCYDDICIIYCLCLPFLSSDRISNYIIMQSNQENEMFDGKLTNVLKNRKCYILHRINFLTLIYKPKIDQT